MLSAYNETSCHARPVPPVYRQCRLQTSTDSEQISRRWNWNTFNWQNWRNCKTECGSWDMIDTSKAQKQWERTASTGLIVCCLTTYQHYLGYYCQNIRASRGQGYQRLHWGPTTLKKIGIPCVPWIPFSECVYVIVCVCACVREWVRECVRACVHACVCVISTNLGTNSINSADGPLSNKTTNVCVFVCVHAHHFHLFLPVWISSDILTI